MVGYDIHEFRGSYLSFVGGKMEKSAIIGQTLRIGIGTRSWYRYPWCRREVVMVPIKVVPVPINSEGLVPVPVKMVKVPLLPTTLFLHIFALLSPIFVHQLFRDLKK